LGREEARERGRGAVDGTARARSFEDEGDAGYATHSKSPSGAGLNGGATQANGAGSHGVQAAQRGEGTSPAKLGRHVSKRL